MATHAWAVPVAPSNLSVTASQGVSQTVTLSWDSDANTLVSYNVYVATGALGKYGLLNTPSWTYLMSVIRTAVTTTVTFPDNTGDVYRWYAIRAQDSTGESASSNLGY